MLGALCQRLETSLGARLLALLAGLIVVASTLFLATFLWFYRDQLARERAFASRQVSMLFQAALENAMVKRDLMGLKEILRRLGRQPDVHGVMLTNPEGRVRFASHSRLLRKPVVRNELAACGSACGGSWPPRREYARLLNDPLLGPILRTVKPIANRPVCTPCHGPVDRHPVNGVLIADFDARAIRQEALLGAAGMAGAGGLIILVVLLAAWRFMHRDVLRPVRDLARGAKRLAEGDLAVRVPVKSRDELGDLARVFNDMATHIESLVNRIRAHDAFLQGLIDAVPDGIRVIGPDYRILLVNRSYREQIAPLARPPGGDHHDHHYPPDPVGEPCYRSAHGREEPCPHTLFTCPLETLHHRDGPVRLLHAHVRADGGKLPVEIVAAALTDANGRRLVVEAIRDLSRQVDITQEQRLAELGQLATGVAHEIHNPLASVRLGLQAMLRAAERGRPVQEVLSYLRKVETAVDQCIDVTGRMLRLSLPPSEKPELVDLAAVTADMAMLLRFEAEKLGVEMRVEAAGEARILGSEAEMRMLVLNLVQNAFHAMPTGGRLTLRVREARDEVILEVADTGVGMDEETRRHIFEPFFSRRADGRRGTGLGLTICRGIVDRHHGTVEVISAPGAGTTFVIRLPAARLGLAEAHRDETDGKGPQRKADAESTA